MFKKDNTSLGFEFSSNRHVKRANFNSEGFQVVFAYQFVRVFLILSDVGIAFARLGYKPIR